MSIRLGNTLLSGTPDVSGKANSSLNNLTSSGQAIINAAVKTGCVLPFAGSTAPDGYLICDGSAVSRTTYSALFAVIGTTYGTGDGSTTFNIPDYTNLRNGATPDWDSIILFGSAGAWSSYTAPSDGFFLLVSGADAVNYLNNNYVRADIYFSGYSIRAGGYGACSFVEVSEGTVITKQSSNGANYAYFVPYKGNAPPDNYIIKY